MSVYSIANRTTQAGTTAPSLEVRASATGRPRIMEIGMWLNAATQSPIGIGRPQAIGVTPTSPVTVQAEDPSDGAGATQTALAWGTAPTVPLQFFRRLNIAAAIGAGVILTFPRGLLILNSNSIVHWNVTAVSLLDAHHVVDE